MPAINTTDTKGAQRTTTTNAPSTPRASLEQRLLKVLQGADKAPLPPAQAQKALQLIDAMIAKLGGTQQLEAATANVDEAQRSQMIVQTWSDNWGATIPKLDKATHDKLAAEYMKKIQARQKEIAPNGEVARTLHRKGVFATTEAKFTINPNLPPELRHGPFAQPGGELRAIVRLSNASGKAQDDTEKDQRGLAVRFTNGDGSKIQDLLATNFPTSHAKDTDDFVAATALLKGILRGGPEFFGSMPPSDSFRMLGFLRKVLKESDSLATESYYSRSQFQLGDKLVEYRWVPVDQPGGTRGGGGDKDKLNADLVARHKDGPPMKWRLEMRGFVDEKSTPTSDGREGWNGPFIAVGELEIPVNRNASRDSVDAALGAVEDMGYSIGNRWDDGEQSMKGRGVLNEFREEVYGASQSGRGTDGAKAKACPYGFG